MENEKTFAQMVRRYRTLKARDAKIQDELKELKSEILDHMDSIGSTRESGKTWTVIVSTRTSMRFDEKALQEELGEDLLPWKKPSITTALIIR